MSSANADALTGAGEFRAKQPGSEPIATSGHQPGKLVGNDAKPEFHAQTLPAGTAPADRTFKPNNVDETIVDQSAAVDVPSAADTITGASSADVHTGLGHPGSGQTSQELHGHVDKRAGGAEGRGGTAPAADLVDKRDPSFADQRVIGSDSAELKNELGGAPAEELEQTNEKYKVSRKTSQIH